MEEEEDESDRPSSDGLGSESEGDSDDSSDAGGMNYFFSIPPYYFNVLTFNLTDLEQYNPRARAAPQKSSAPSASTSQQQQSKGPRLVSARPTQTNVSSGRSRATDRSTAFGDRRNSHPSNGRNSNANTDDTRVTRTPGGGAEISWVPKSSGERGGDSLFDDGFGGGDVADKKGKGKGRRKDGVEEFGAGMEKGGKAVDEDAGRKGRTHRRTNIRSGSRNTFRQM